MLEYGYDVVWVLFLQRVVWRKMYETRNTGCGNGIGSFCLIGLHGFDYLLFFLDFAAFGAPSGNKKIK